MNPILIDIGEVVNNYMNIGLGSKEQIIDLLEQNILYIKLDKIEQLLNVK